MLDVCKPIRLYPGTHALQTLHSDTVIKSSRLPESATHMYTNIRKFDGDTLPCGNAPVGSATRYSERK